jgi:DNA repair exonuclease SbcCD ATPase subunit
MTPQSVQSRIEELERILNDRDKDLELAAEIGQSLLQQNQQLELKIKEMESQNCPNCAVHQHRLETLEHSYSDLSENYEILQEKERETNEVLRQQRECSKKLEQLQAQLSQDLADQTEHNKQLKDEKQKLAREKGELVKDLHAVQANAEQLSTKVMHLEKSNKDLQAILNQSSCSSSEIHESWKAAEQKNQELEFKVQELEQMVETYQSYRETCDEQTLTIDQLNLELEFVRESNQKLTSRLAMLDSNLSHAEPDQGSKTLLSEIEDRRQELIRAHQALAEKHAGLAQTHELSLSRQQRMKHHIARLSQLTVADYSEEKIKLLEQQLAQCESEKSELEARLDRLQRQQHVIIPRGWDDEVEEPSNDLERIQLLEYRVQQLMEECDSMKQANQTLRLVKTAETDKVHQITATLHERERELETTKRLYSNLKFEFDELKHTLEHPDLKRVADLEEKDATLRPATTADPPSVPQAKSNTNSTKQASSVPFINTVVQTAENPEEVNKENRGVEQSSKEKSTSKTKTIKVDRTKLQQQECKQQ